MKFIYLFGLSFSEDEIKVVNSLGATPVTYSFSRTSLNSLRDIKRRPSHRSKRIDADMINNRLLSMILK